MINAIDLYPALAFAVILFYLPLDKLPFFGLIHLARVSQEML